MKGFLKLLLLGLSLNPFSVLGQQKGITIQNQRELFVDDYLIDKLNNMELRLATPVSGGKAIDLSKPWEGRFGLALSVMKVGNIYRLYYRGLPEVQSKKNPPVNCYAESLDGINWVRPDLKQKEAYGTIDNNVLPDAAALVVLYDDRPEVPAAERFKSLTGNSKQGLHVIVSADGFSWKPYNKDTTAVGVAQGYALDSPNVLTWVPSENTYAIYMRGWTGDIPGVTPSTPNEFGQIGLYYHGIRTLMRSTSKDLINWSKPEMMKFGDTPMEHLYTNATQPYFRAPQILISMPMRYNPDSTANVLSINERIKYDIHPVQWRGVSDAVFMTSRGGNTFDRKFMQSFIRPGLNQKNWAARSQIPALGVIPTGPEEISFFVTRGYATRDVYIERLTLRTDGFVSLNAGYQEGSVITRPVVLAGNKMLLNYSSTPIGYVKVVLLNEKGKELAGFGEADAELIRGDKIDREVQWKSGKSLKDLDGSKVRIKFIAKDADIYSFAVFD